MKKVILMCFALSVLAYAEENVAESPNEDEVGLEEIDQKVSRGEIQSCRGCSLNRLPDVKAFVYGDISKYDGLEFHPIPGAPPQLVLFDKSDNELKRIDLSSLTRKQCNEQVNKWFKLKEEEPVDSKAKEEL